VSAANCWLFCGFVMLFWWFRDAQCSFESLKADTERSRILQSAMNQTEAEMKAGKKNADRMRATDFVDVLNG